MASWNSTLICDSPSSILNLGFNPYVPFKYIRVCISTPKSRRLWKPKKIVNSRFANVSKLEDLSNPPGAVFRIQPSYPVYPSGCWPQYHYLYFSRYINMNKRFGCSAVVQAGSLESSCCPHLEFPQFGHVSESRQTNKVPREPCSHDWPSINGQTCLNLR